MNCGPCPITDGAVRAIAGSVDIGPCRGGAAAGGALATTGCGGCIPGAAVVGILAT